MWCIFFTAEACTSVVSPGNAARMTIFACAVGRASILLSKGIPWPLTERRTEPVEVCRPSRYVQEHLLDGRCIEVRGVVEG